MDNRTQSENRRKRRRASPYKIKEVILLPSPSYRNVPKFKNKVELNNKGLIMDRFELDKNWSEGELREKLKRTFEDKLRDREGEVVSFEFVKAIGSNITEVHVSQGQEITGKIIIRIAKQGPIYIRAQKQLGLLVSKEENNDDNFNTNEEPSEEPSETVCGGYSVTSLENSDTSPSTSSSNNVSTLSTERTPYSSYLGLLEDIDPIDISDSDDEVEELRMQSAIQNSLASQASNASDDTDSLNLAHVIGEHVKTEMVGKSHDVDVSKNQVNVRRKHVFTDGIKKIGRSSFQASLPLSVKFADELGSSEGAVDLGGPTREFLFLRLAIQDMFLSNAFAGPANRKMLVLNQEARRENLYFLCGKLLAISLCNGGSVGRCLSPCLYQFLVYGESTCKPSIDDVHDYTIKNTLLQINGCNDNSSFVEVIKRESVIDCFSQAGYYGLAKFENKRRLLDELCRFYVVDKACSALIQFKEGLSTLNVLPLLKKHPKLFEDVFCHEAKLLTAFVIDGLFKVVYAKEGTRQRKQEELIVMYWRDYLQDCQVPEAPEGGSSSEDIHVKLKDILIFATCASEVPRLGFQPSPTIQFWNDVRPRSNTCGNVLFLPLHKMISELSYDVFKSFMDDAIINSPTFGAP